MLIADRPCVRDSRAIRLCRQWEIVQAAKQLSVREAPVVIAVSDGVAFVFTQTDKAVQTRGSALWGRHCVWPSASRELYQVILNYETARTTKTIQTPRWRMAPRLHAARSETPWQAAGWSGCAQWARPDRRSHLQGREAQRRRENDLEEAAGWQCAATAWMQRNAPPTRPALPQGRQTATR